ncbi:MAG: DEAD/DEAH box helicase, partial [Planctomycetota bacterium]
MIVTLAAIASSLVLGCAAAVRSWPVLRLRLRMRSLLAPLKREERAIHRLQDRVQRELVGAAEDWQAAARDRRIDELPVLALDPLIDAPIQWKSLEEAGYSDLRDIEKLKRRELEEVRGIGPASAKRIVEARERLLDEVHSERPPLPSPDDPYADSARLRRAAHRSLWVRDRVQSRLHELYPREPARRVREAHGLLRAVTLGVDSERLLNAERALEKLESAVSEREYALEDSRRARRTLATELGPTMVGDHLAEDHARRYSDYCILIGNALEIAPKRRWSGPPPVGAPQGLPVEIAERVEAQALSISSMRVTLRGYQAFGARYLLAQRRTILGDEMGLGKTIQALAAMTHLHESEGLDRFLVVAPAGVLFNWLREIRTRTVLDAHLFHGSQRDAAVALWQAQGGVGVTSFSTLRKLELHADLPGEQNGRHIDMLIVDEAHLVKNPAAYRTMAVAGHALRSDLVCLMSGTPMENRLGEFSELVRLVQPDLVDELQALEDRALAPDRQRFQVAVAPAYLRRNKEDVLGELPPLIEMEEWVELSRSELDAYAKEVLARNFMGMRRVVTAPRNAKDFGRGSAKLRRAAAILEEYRDEGRKVLVFSFFLDVLSAADEFLGARNRIFGKITGGVSASERQGLIDQFRDTAGPGLLLLQIQAGGVGINLQAASAILLLEPQWKPSTEEQAIARAHRMGQHQAVTVHRCLAKDTVDERMLEILEEKQDLFDAYARPSA